MIARGEGSPVVQRLQRLLIVVGQRSDERVELVLDAKQDSHQIRLVAEKIRRVRFVHSGGTHDTSTSHGRGFP